MPGVLLTLFLGWPAILATIVIAAFGLIRNNYRLLVAAAFVALPFSWYLSGFPVIRSPIFLLPLLLFVSGFAMYRRHEMLAWFIAIPYFLAILLLFYVISAQ